MNENDIFWQRFGGMIRKAKNDCPLTPQQAQKELEALSPSEEISLSADEIEEAIKNVIDGNFEPEEGDSDIGWVDSCADSGVEEDVFALNRNKGEDDPEVNARLEELRKKAADEEDDAQQDEAGMDDPKEPPGKSG